ncbi:16S rRNA (adenine(1518)-N(6)/adenine(1519)-N(6))-dimethyltransferase RsmA [Mycoplasmopsis columbinasalis]|uniref:Ribosomal RNA small subunit methyltransferase A n=1 Tax=Mycoplasmopsis columbinasalis TaxID=114880 RepID=A0A449B9W1_9BACT|nr:16S rRNA (adenine(1518)-N(6)/adenine(1519)-N(6))-dimethyltransferase RsmA [Mycoplasmopsis columbinasalis]VEU77957.1 dimethyladenosine transferase rRNA modification enzyme [Mycoplasmopsis columbinasalis]
MFQEKNKQVFAKKKFGQNFLINQTLIKKIVALIEPANKHLIEIGPGRGALTKMLAPQAQRLTAFEIDPDMKNYLLAQNILNEEQIVLQDFLQTDLNSYKGYEVVGNIPYYITSDILFKLFDYRYCFKKAYLMVQNEVADRLVAKPNTNAYSKLTLTAQHIAKVTKCFKVPSSAFNPMPKVDSAIIMLEFYQDETDNYDQLKEFFKLCFLARRKKLSWALQTKYTSAAIKNTYNILNLNDLTRIQELNLETVLKLYELLNERTND